MQLANKLAAGNKFTTYRCKNGLTDCASPIVIEGEHVANLFIGQFLMETPDSKFFKKQAFDPASILIVDDIGYNREMLALYLEGWDFNILFAKNGREAIEQAKKHFPDVITLDMKMPELDGYVAIELLGKDDSLKSIPVIAITASALKEDEKLLSKICNGYLRKPVGRADLIRELMRLLPHIVKSIYKNEQRTTDLQKPSKLDELLPDQMGNIPRELVAEIENVVIRGSVQEIEDVLGEVKNYDSFVAMRLKMLFDDFEYEKILALIQSVKEQK